jgi:hypothetical protein
MVAIGCMSTAARASWTAIAPNGGGGAPQFIYLTDGKTVPPSAAFGAAAGTRLLHKLDLLSIDGNGSPIQQSSRWTDSCRSHAASRLSRSIR